MRSTGAAIIILLLLGGFGLPAPGQDAAQDQSAQGQPPQTIDQIRVIGNRRIPKETILARLFTHVGDIYDPVSIERDFNSLWNTGYFDDLRIERENTAKGIILNIFVREKPNIR
jgi:outer membrane protein insertion porin family